MTRNEWGVVQTLFKLKYMTKNAWKQSVRHQDVSLHLASLVSRANMMVMRCWSTEWYADSLSNSPSCLFPEAVLPLPPRWKKVNKKKIVRRWFSFVGVVLESEEMKSDMTRNATSLLYKGVLTWATALSWSSTLYFTLTLDGPLRGRHWVKNLEWMRIINSKIQNESEGKMFRFSEYLDVWLHWNQLSVKGRSLDAHRLPFPPF